MNAGKFRRSTHLDLLKGIRRSFLARLLETYAAELASRSISLPSPELGDTDYLVKAEAIFAQSLPDKLTDTLSAIAELVRLRSQPHPSTLPSPHPPTPRFALRKGLGVWDLTFDGKEAPLNHERGIFYVAWLLYNPPEHPIHALDLIAKIPEMYRRQLGLPQLVDPATGKSSSLDSGARIQERSLALDDAQAMRAILRRERELETILDSEEESEPVKAEALRELEAITEFQRQHGRRTTDSAQRAVRTVRMAITRAHRNLLIALDTSGSPHPVLGPFADHLEKHLLIPSARHGGTGRTRSRGHLAGCFTYSPPPHVTWSH